MVGIWIAPIHPLMMYHGLRTREIMNKKKGVIRSRAPHTLIHLVIHFMFSKKLTFTQQISLLTVDRLKDVMISEKNKEEKGNMVRDLEV
jgi:hypothetical protein